MTETYVARARTTIAAGADEIWRTLVDPDARFFLGATITSTYEVGTPIVFEGEFQGKHFRDHGTVEEVDRPRLLRYSHFSPLGGRPDVPESYHHLTFTLDEHDDGTTVTLVQDNAASPEEAEHSSGMYQQMLGALAEAVTG
ncbi:hypothetical protein Cch01nite_27000 [Cellulomonas chitinilytica]|uniref:Activator of Hsp90 ATPase homologue 1/2-like C-terminal domain-containing protein n=1 Tax=Cellulomonas chitinilytica TaxID=398759 RepID=A0A919P5G5_9CELL|nr:SRPBCC family protein [Cellulomonas chitinilytica]GIG21976.1 hypothetical protein Cch01nite_27000 [Cellulomonas chitinilytica]